MCALPKGGTARLAILAPQGSKPGGRLILVPHYEVFVKSLPAAQGRATGDTRKPRHRQRLARSLASSFRRPPGQGSRISTPAVAPPADVFDGIVALSSLTLTGHSLPTVQIGQMRLWDLPDYEICI